MNWKRITLIVKHPCRVYFLPPTHRVPRAVDEPTKIQRQLVQVRAKATNTKQSSPKTRLWIGCPWRKTYKHKERGERRERERTQISIYSNPSQYAQLLVSCSLPCLFLHSINIYQLHSRLLRVNRQTNQRSFTQNRHSDRRILLGTNRAGWKFAMLTFHLSFRSFVLGDNSSAPSVSLSIFVLAITLLYQIIFSYLQRVGVTSLLILNIHSPPCWLISVGVLFSNDARRQSLHLCHRWSRYSSTDRQSHLFGHAQVQRLHGQSLHVDEQRRQRRRRFNSFRSFVDLGEKFWWKSHDWTATSNRSGMRQWRLRLCVSIVNWIENKKRKDFSPRSLFVLLVFVLEFHQCFQGVLFFRWSWIVRLRHFTCANQFGFVTKQLG